MDSLLADIRNRYSVEKTPDLLFITGDVAFSGKAEEYTQAEAFISELRTATSIPQERLFIVPGNHDIDRKLEEDAFNGAKAALKNPVEVDRFLASEGRRKTVFRREEAFRTFVNKIAPPDNGGYSSTSFAHSKRTAVGPIKVGVLLLDSAWLAEGGPADIGTLLIGERQIIDASAAPHEALNFGLVHHPFAWLREFEQIPIENLALQRVHIMLRGHVHAADLRSVESLERRLIFFTAGATFETRTADNSYSWSKVDLAAGVGTTVIHQYVHATKSWQASEPKTWSLARSAPPMVLEDAVEFSTMAGGKYIYYRASLLAGHITEIPRLTNDGVIFLSFDVELDDENGLGKLIIKLRNMFYWRAVWDQELWFSEAGRLAEEMESTLKVLQATSSQIEVFLDGREGQCRRNANAIIGNSSPTEAPVFDLLAELGRLEEWEQALQVIERWSSGNLLGEPERTELDRIAVKAYLELHRIDDAKAKVLSIVERDSATSFDLYLAATCFYLAKEYPKANEYMHKALDGDIQIDLVQELALRIAGQTGDKGLRERVMQHD